MVLMGWAASGLLSEGARASHRLWALSFALQLSGLKLTADPRIKHIAPKLV